MPVITQPDFDLVKATLPDINDLKYLTKGGFKLVYTGTVEKQFQAIKFIYIPEDPNDPEVKEENLRRAKREVEILQKIKTKFLVKTGNLKPREVSIDGNTYYLYSEEYLKGENLTDLINKNYKPQQAELKELCSNLVSCISEFKNSSSPIVHRDIKPLNIIRTNDPDRKFILFDLGIAFYTTGTNLTKNPQQVPGTVPYYAPEFFDNKFRDRLDFRADLYNTGLTVYEFATGSHPFRSGNQYTTLNNILNNTPDPIKTLRGDLDDLFSSLIDSWLKKKPMLRESNFQKINNIIQQ